MKKNEKKKNVSGHKEKREILLQYFKGRVVTKNLDLKFLIYY